jgi:hypothetical protein
LTGRTSPLSVDRRSVALVVVSAAALLLAIIGVYATLDAVAAGPGRRQPEVWEIPGAYKGLVTAHFGVASCPPLVRRDGKLVYTVARDGTFCTSDLLPEGFAVDTYEYLYPDGRRVPLRSPDEVAKLVVRGRLVPDPSSDLFIFVGTPEDQQRARDNLPRD